VIQKLIAIHEDGMPSLARVELTTKPLPCRSRDFSRRNQIQMVFVWKLSDNCARSTLESVHRFLQAATVARAIMLRYELKSRDKYEK
jgi:hypothetical protein